MVGRGLLYQLHPRHVRWWQWLALVLLAIVLLVRSWLPEFLRRQIVAKIASTTPAHIQLADADINLLRGYLALQQLTFTLDGDTQPVLTINDLAVNVSLRALLRRRIVIEDVHVNGVHVQVVHEASGQFNLNRLFPSLPSEPEEPPSDLPTLTVQHIRITDSQLTYHDLTRTPGVRFPLAIAELTAADIALQANGLIAPVAMEMNGMLDNNPLRGEAQVAWQRARASIDAKLETKQLALATIDPYLRNVLAVQKVTGQLGVSLQYRYHQRNPNSSAPT